MRSKIIKSILVVFLLISIGMVHNVVKYTNQQEYAQIAAQQVNDDNAYTELKTQPAVSTAIEFIFAVVTIGSLSLFYFIWKPKKEEKE